jgi:hypothetical protein
LNFSIKIAQRHCRFKPKKSQNEKDSHPQAVIFHRAGNVFHPQKPQNRRIYTYPARISPTETSKSKDLHLPIKHFTHKKQQNREGLHLPIKDFTLKICEKFEGFYQSAINPTLKTHVAKLGRRPAERPEAKIRRFHT